MGGRGASRARGFLKPRASIEGVTGAFKLALVRATRFGFNAPKAPRWARAPRGAETPRQSKMRADLIILAFAYVLSQFYRAFLAVLTQVLDADLGATPEMLATASGFWFLAFAAMQIPVGWSLDRIGPRLTSSVLLLIGGAGGAAVFAMAQTPAHVSYAMLLIGVGCSPVLMANYFIFALIYSPRVFATLAAVILGVGSVGNLASALPTTLAVEAWGWRSVM